MPIDSIIEYLGAPIPMTQGIANLNVPQSLTQLSSQQLKDVERVQSGDDIQSNIQTLLQHAGFKRSADGSLKVDDSLEAAKLHKTQQSSKAENASRTGAAQQGPSLSELGMPPLPQVQWSKETRAGAESFTHNFDAAMSEALSAKTTQPIMVNVAGRELDLSRLSPENMLAAFLKLNINDPNNSVETHNQLYEASSNLRQAAIEEAKAAVEEQIEAKKEAEGYAKVMEVVNTVLSVASIIAAVALTVATFGAGAAIFAAGAIIGGGLVGMAITGDAQGFLTGASITAAIVGLVTGVGVLTGAMQATQSVSTGARWAAAGVQAGAEAGKAVGNFKLSQKMTAADEAGLEALDAERRAQQAQQVLEEENAIMQMILESKNRTVEAVLKMMNVSLNTNLRLQSALMSKG